MFTLRIGDKRITGVVTLQGGADIHIADTSQSGDITLTSSQKSYAEWYADFLDNKSKHLLTGGGGVGYAFSKGVASDGGYLGTSSYLRTVNSTNASLSGNMQLLGGKTVDVGVTPDNDITISLPIHHFNAAKYFKDLYWMFWRLYHCLNSISGRLQLWAPTTPPDGKPGLTKMGPYLGTYLNYQAIVARWNSFAWANAFTLVVDEVGERATIAVGYTNLECVLSGITYSMFITINEQESTAGSDKATELTLYNQGVDSSLDNDKISVVTTFERNSTTDKPNYISGSGFEGVSPSPLTDARLTTRISGISADTPAFRQEQYYRNIVAIAPCIGVDKAYTVQDRDGSEDSLDKIVLNVHVTWILGDAPPAGVVDDRRRYSKDAKVSIVAVGYEKQETTE